MLVLSRRIGESIYIGDDVIITVQDVRGDVVRIGIVAPRSVQVHREEVYQALQEANAAAASSGPAQPDAAAALSALLKGHRR